MPVSRAKIRGVHFPTRSNSLRSLPRLRKTLATLGPYHRVVPSLLVTGNYSCFAMGSSPQSRIAQSIFTKRLARADAWSAPGLFQPRLVGDDVKESRSLAPVNAAFQRREQALRVSGSLAGLGVVRTSPPVFQRCVEAPTAARPGCCTAICQRSKAAWSSACRTGLLR